jgi:hypothetical protein
VSSRFVRTTLVVTCALGLVSRPVLAATAEEAQLEELERGVAELKARMALVREYADKGGLGALERANQRFSEGETQFLLENYEGCAALLFDAVEDADFRRGPHYSQSLYYLGESLYLR